MKKYLFKCMSCSTIMSIETKLDEKYIHQAPPCPCGKSRMVNMASDKYAYNLWD
jgi:DNA-directed RNA polymerase subunit RPC12/RpoP